MKMWLNSIKRTMVRLAALLLVVCLLPVACFAENTESTDNSGDDWIKFILICNEGMSNSGGNVGNTMMVVSMNIYSGIIRLMSFTWDTFVDYTGYDVPQKIDMAYRNNGPEETMNIFNQNFNLDIDMYMSLNYSNLLGLINTYGGVTVDISRAERNALNSMIASKKDAIQSQSETGFVNQLMVEMLAQENYLEDYGPDTHLNGLQSIAYGWLQYDSIYNCCQRQQKVISNLFASVANSIGEKVVLYSEASGKPDDVQGRRAINIDDITNEDMDFLQELVSPIFQMSYNNLESEDIRVITMALAHNAYNALRQGVNIFEAIDCQTFPLEALNDYDLVAGTYGHLVDKEANTKAMKEFLFNEDR